MAGKRTLFHDRVRPDSLEQLFLRHWTAPSCYQHGKNFHYPGSKRQTLAVSKKHAPSSIKMEGPKFVITSRGHDKKSTRKIPAFAKDFHTPKTLRSAFRS